MMWQKYLIFFTVFCVLHQLNAQEISVFNHELYHKVEKLYNILTEYEAKVLNETDNKCISAYSSLIEKWSESPAALEFLVKLIDSSSKIESGITSLNLYDFGSFDICYNLEANIDEDVLYGKYCLATVNVSISFLKNEGILTKGLPRIEIKQMRHLQSSSTMMLFQHGFCIPSACSATEMNEIVEYILGNFTFKPKFKDQTCYAKNETPELTTGAICTIVLLSIILSIVIISSLYEYYLLLNEQKPPHEILLAFSAISNGKKIITNSKNPEQLLCLNGIRAISMAWIILGHVYFFHKSGPIENVVDINRGMSDKLQMWLLAAGLSVDTFFAIGGLVTVYTFLNSQDKGVPFNIPLYYLHRYLRLTPALAVLILIYANLVDYLGNGPLWYFVDFHFAEPCIDHWWSLLLYIQNFVNVESQCIAHSWYLSIDFQLFLLSPIVLCILSKKPKFGYALLGILIIFGCIIPIVISYHYDLRVFTSTDTDQSDDYSRYYYHQTHTRFGPYVIGMTFGAIIYKMRREKKEPRKTKKNILISIGLWIIALGGLVASLYCGAALLDGSSASGTAFYNGLHRNAWSIALGLVILLCVSGFGGPIDSFLSIPIFQFVAKLSYCTYLVHILVIAIRVYSTKNVLRFSHLGVMHIFWADFMVTMALAFIFCLCFESPMIVLEKHLLGGLMGKKENKNKSKTVTA